MERVCPSFVEAGVLKQSFDLTVSQGICMTFDELKVSLEAASNKRHSSNPKNLFEAHGFGMILRGSICGRFNEPSL